MRSLPSALAGHIAGSTTTLAWCWRLTRRDGLRLGFTDHDRDLVFDGTIFEAAAGFTASEIREAVGLGVDNLEVESALSSARLREDDIVSGTYDDARVEIWRVNWQSPAQRVLMRAGSIGEIRRNGLAFTAEVRGLSHYLQQDTGRVLQFGCDADLGDSRCKVSLASPAYHGVGSIVAPASPRLFTVDGFTDFPINWFARGLLTFTSGNNSGRTYEVKRHTVAVDAVTMELWQEPARPIMAGDTFSASAGCDKQLTTCSAKFSNAANFRGFPHMPGNDFVAAVVRTGRLPSRSGS